MVKIIINFHNKLCLFIQKYFHAKLHLNKNQCECVIYFHAFSTTYIKVLIQIQIKKIQDLKVLNLLFRFLHRCSSRTSFVHHQNQSIMSRHIFTFSCFFMMTNILWRDLLNERVRTIIIDDKIYNRDKCTFSSPLTICKNLKSTPPETCKSHNIPIFGIIKKTRKKAYIKDNLKQK
jgi:hypothetical protein